MSNDELRQTYNRIADDWHADHLKDTWWAEGTEAFLTFLKKGDHILDLGCAGGVKSKFLIDHGFRVVGSDLSEEMIRIAKSYEPRGTFMQMDILQTSSLKERFDGVFIQAVLLHIPKIQIPTAVHQAVSVLKPGGIFYVAVKEQRVGQPAEEIKMEHDYGYPYQRFFSYFTTGEIRGHIEQSGCRVLREIRTVSGKTVWIQLIAQRMTTPIV